MKGADVRREDGFALVATIALMVIVLLVAAVGATAVVRSFDETNRSRSSTTALTAADSAIDIIAWRMNKQLVASEITNIDGLGAEAIGMLGCADVDGLGVVQLDLSATECTLSVPTLGGGAEATCTSALSASLFPGGVVNLSQLLAQGLLSRDIICSATVDNATRRVFARVSLDVEPAGVLASPTSLWEQTDWEECSVDAAAACPPA